MIGYIVTTVVVIIVLGIFLLLIYLQYKKVLREAKNYERGLKMVPMYIHIPPAGEDLEANGRDERDVTEEILSQAQIMYDIISSTIQKGFKSKIYGQRHISFEILAHDGLIHYYVVVPAVLVDVVRQAVSSAYPSARLDEVEEKNIFNQAGKISGTIGGEFTLKKEYAYPIATYHESKRDATRAILNALSTITKEDGAAIQLMIRPAKTGWIKEAISCAERIKKEKGVKKPTLLSMFSPKELMGVLWKPPEIKETKPEDKQLSSLEQNIVEAIEEKTRYPGYETLIRIVVSSNTASRSQALLKSIVSAFSLFDSTTNNGLKFSPAKDVEELVTAYIFRFFPQTIEENILNSVELATIFHLPDQDSIPTSQVQRQLVKQVDGPNQPMTEGLLLGFNEFRGVKKPIRLRPDDRRRHTYFIGQTGTGKSSLLENFVYQDMIDGRGLVFIDPHGDSAEKILGFVPKDRAEDVIYFCPGDLENPMGLNLFEFSSKDQQDFLIQETINMLYALYDPNRQGFIGARFEQIFRNCALLLMSDPNGGTLIDVPKLLVDPDFVKQKLKYVTDQSLMDYWTKEWPAAQKSNDAGEVTSWVASKFAAFLSNTMMRNIIGQNKSSFDIRHIMDNKKILLVNLSKGLTGELNSRLLGMIFVMKFQVAAMSRADTPENERQDFCLYVDEFQNFATESFSTILSEARKYRLNLILANQFMAQLTDTIRESILGNIGTIISGRLGVTDAELMQKKFMPIFDAEDLTKLPNFQGVISVLINGVPSSAFSISLNTWPMAKSNKELGDALKKLSAAKYGRPRAQVEREITERIGSKASDSPTEALLPPDATAKSVNPQAQAPMPSVSSDGSSFLDEWLAKRKQIAEVDANNKTKPLPSNEVPQPEMAPSQDKTLQEPVTQPRPQLQAQPPKDEPSVLQRGSDDEISVHIR